ncbi:MAG: UDP-N-acetylglucosamine 2-epimerase [Myxococcales bacterium 68-20]|nr:UDP-N-acetylglucosamine 2-epimerase (non-hydrolyzing) [Myxococcales bacterium]OJY16672.1 MAG: UDP-N-acetylglucosamine 2-epimerase [Myxococcales bacterium 68-20]
MTSGSGKKRRVLCVFGTRPEAIKMALLSKALRAHPDFEAEVCVTAQHRSMLDQVLTIFDVKPAFDLDLMKDNQGLADITSRIVTGMTSVLRSFQPDWLLVQGDTTTAFVAALAAFYEKVSVGHVEAGLRTGFKYSPWPEEMNRQLVGRLADLHLPPTERAKKALLAEGVPDERIHITGNTVVDSLLWVSKKLDDDRAERAKLDERFSFLDPKRRLILITGHRRESFGKPFEDMCNAFVDIVRARTDVEIVYPVHLNPNVQAPVKAILASAPEELRGRIHLIDPIEYLPFVYLMKRCHFIVTDSGGVQEEAPSLAKPCLVTRNDTERPEAVEAGTAKLIGTQRERIVEESLRLLDDETHYRSMSRAHNPYGDGKANDRIVQILSSQG